MGSAKNSLTGKQWKKKVAENEGRGGEAKRGTIVKDCLYHSKH